MGALWELVEGDEVVVELCFDFDKFEPVTFYVSNGFISDGAWIDRGLVTAADENKPIIAFADCAADVDGFEAVAESLSDDVARRLTHVAYGHRAGYRWFRRSATAQDNSGCNWDE